METSERHRRIVYSLMMLPAKVAAEFQMPTHETRHWFETAYFQVLRERGLTLKEIAEFLGIGTRKVSQLSTKLRNNFFDAERDIGLPRRIEYLIWGEPISEQRVAQLLASEFDEGEVREAIQRLIKQERVELFESGTVELLRLSKNEARLYDDGFLSRIDGLNHLVENLFRAVDLRFVSPSDSAFVRTLTFRVPRDDGQKKLREIYERLFQDLADLEASIPDDEESQPMNLSVLWAPTEGD